MRVNELDEMFQADKDEVLEFLRSRDHSVHPFAGVDDDTLAALTEKFSPPILPEADDELKEHPGAGELMEPVPAVPGEWNSLPPEPEFDPEPAPEDLKSDVPAEAEKEENMKMDMVAMNGLKRGEIEVPAAVAKEVSKFVGKRKVADAAMLANRNEFVVVTWPDMQKETFLVK